MGLIWLLYFTLLSLLQRIFDEFRQILGCIPNNHYIPGKCLYIEHNKVLLLTVLVCRRDHYCVLYTVYSGIL